MRISSFSLAKRIQGSGLLTFSIATISMWCRLCPCSLKCLPTVFDPVLVECACSLNLVATILLVWPTYWGFLPAQGPLFFLQVIRYITFLLVQSSLLRMGKISWVFELTTLLQNLGEFWHILQFLPQCENPFLSLSDLLSVIMGGRLALMR